MSRIQVALPVACGHTDRREMASQCFYFLEIRCPRAQLRFQTKFQLVLSPPRELEPADADAQRTVSAFDALHTRYLEQLRHESIERRIGRGELRGIRCDLRVEICVVRQFDTLSGSFAVYKHLDASARCTQVASAKACRPFTSFRQKQRQAFDMELRLGGGHVLQPDQAKRERAVHV